MNARADDPEFRTRIDHTLESFVDGQRAILAELGPDVENLADAAIGFVAGGKRLRPQFCYAGWLVAGGTPDEPGIVTAAAALEWLQASALVHDDLMDGSDTRRGRPSVHRAFEARHRDEARHGDPVGFGTSAAVLLGDLLLSWCDEMFRSNGLAHTDEAFRFLDLCKTEVVAGQFLDVAGQTRESLSVAEAMTVVRYKSAKYTVERPLHIGAALAGADPELIAALTEVALPLGEAFQLRDDVLGVFGDPELTGKPAGDDLREGKRTVLVARAAELTDDAGRTLLRTSLGTPEGVDAVRDLIHASGALEAVEDDIARLETAADEAIDRLGSEARQVLGPLALTATRRTR
ncbi:polyprenyl synthetase family protein [Aeromicrobium ginsengisoli]|uniref:polyprenyl synthetase family protein n=1 Tax=Aeromicrobium ginsengisoli TaxID=363867 RepID=UPI001CB6CDBA|nr:polyprenyl synthetase family protein [Aeromicrobium ginsengisoli]